MADKAKTEKTNWFKKHKILTGILIVVGLFIIIGIASGGSEKTTTTTVVTTDQPQAAAPAQAEPPKFDPEVAYPKIENGMTKAQVEEVTGKKSDNCTESAIAGYGTSEYCTYGGFSDKGSISVSYTNGTVSSKSKSTY